MKSAVSMMALSMSIFTDFTMASATPDVLCITPVGQLSELCTTIGGTCGEYYYREGKYYCFRFCECDVGMPCATDEAHAIVRGNETHPSTSYTCQPISEFPVCEVDDVAIVTADPGLHRVVKCICPWVYAFDGNRSHICKD
nr:TPA_inf: conotoxin precursor Tand01 [Conus judaeus]